MRKNGPFHRLVVALIAVLSLAGAGVLVTPSPALAACSATGCNGLDPQAQGCSSGATTLEDFVYQSYYLELRFSSACNAAWVRVTSEGTWSQHAEVWIERSGGYRQPVVEAPNGVAGQWWTRMYSFTYVVRGALKFIPHYAGGEEATFYTAWR